MVDLGKAVASQLIVLHHLALYGPMSDVAGMLAGDLREWLVDQARLAVQVFLVIGGFLAARGMLPTPDAPVGRFPAALPRTLWRRLQRLVPPYAVALLAAVACAFFARALGEYPDIPEAPTAGQFIANALMLQDVLGEPALSAGLWYVAIDLQLYALLALLCAGRAVRVGDGAWRGTATALAVLLLTAGALLVFNRDRTLDIWAPYFFGAYGLGILAQWAQATPHRVWWTTLIVLLTGLALLVEWRSRLALAGTVALVLALDVGRSWRWLRAGPLQRLLAFLSRISYTVFLLHYPVMLVVGAVVYRLWPASPEMHLVGLLVAWGLALLAGWGLERLLASPGSGPLRPSPIQAPSVWRASISKGLSR
ncbi:acyltransferase family protein [uncultured Sphaerotilus sp.]|uniref:acyltransferase family protein n=1 Tax=uncultured Sphaerotilus sp. TaxID=474984 RepID=UPI0030CA5A7F